MKNESSRRGFLGFVFVSPFIRRVVAPSAPKVEKSFSGVLGSGTQLAYSTNNKPVTWITIAKINRIDGFE